jgi:superfamily I DNA/RNA helicase
VPGVKQSGGGPKGPVAGLGTAALGFCGTLHSFCLKLLNAGRGGFREGITVLDDDECGNLIERLRKELAPRATLRDCNEAIARGPDWCENRKGMAWTQPELVAFEFYDFLRANNLVTFDSILFYALKVLRDWGSEPWPWEQLFVDEAQDLTEMDWKIFDAMPFPKRTFTGDTDQEIFQWRSGEKTNGFVKRCFLATDEMRI